MASVGKLSRQDRTLTHSVVAVVKPKFTQLETAEVMVMVEVKHKVEKDNRTCTDIKIVITCRTVNAVVETIIKVRAKPMISFVMLADSEDI